MCQSCVCLMHTCRPVCAVMSENYIVFIEQPIKLDMLKFMMYRIQGKSFHKIMTWEPDCDTIFHLVNRRTGEVGQHPFTAQQLHLHHEIKHEHTHAHTHAPVC